MGSHQSNGRQVIDIYTTTEKLFRLQEGYTFKPSGRFAKLQKKLWDWGVKKGLITPNMVEHAKVIRVMVDGGDLFERLYNQYEGVFHSLGKPKVVYMGPDTFREIARQPQMQNYNGGPFSMNAIGAINTKAGRQLFELPVHVIPHMEGCLIV